MGWNMSKPLPPVAVTPAPVVPKPAAPVPEMSGSAVPKPAVPAAPAPTAPAPAAPAPVAPAPVLAPPVPAAPSGQLVPKFNVYQAQGGDSATFVFKDATDGNTQYWQWDFGDQIGHSNEQNPTYKFKSGGTYTVRMFVANDEFRKQAGPDAWLSASTKLPVTAAPAKEGFGSVISMDWIIWLIIFLIIIAILYGKC